MNLENIVAKLIEKRPNLQAVYVFGSVASDAARSGSDLDIAVLCAQPMEVRDRYELAQELADTVSRDVDLIDLRTSSTVMQAQIVAHGNRIFCIAEDTCARFENIVFASYARLNEERREILREIKEREAVYG